ncbi:MAG: hypothetical protein LDL24_00370 [Treponema sp.]|nr:hypothetical protein [Treponema sp.]
MTLSGRNRLIILGIVWSSLTVVFLGYFSIKTFSIYPQIEMQAINRTFGFAHTFFAPFFAPYPFAPLLSIWLSILYSLAGIITVYVLFEKTQAPEILFFANFVLSLSLEISRMANPLINYYGTSLTYSVFAGKLLLFSRLFGLFSLFLASVYAAGMEMQRYGLLLLFNGAVCFALASGVPIDSMSWDTAMTPQFGFSDMFFLIEATIVIITILSFFIAIKNKSSKDYMYVSIGIVLVLLGRDLLLHADTILEIALAVPMLALGTWMYCSNLHQYYLWL